MFNIGREMLSPMNLLNLDNHDTAFMACHLDSNHS